MSHLNDLANAEIAELKAKVEALKHEAVFCVIDRDEIFLCSAPKGFCIDRLQELEDLFIAEAEDHLEGVSLNTVTVAVSAFWDEGDPSEGMPEGWGFGDDFRVLEVFVEDNQLAERGK
jgi:hypothetical protein